MSAALSTLPFLFRTFPTEYSAEIRRWLGWLFVLLKINSAHYLLPADAVNNEEPLSENTPKRKELFVSFFSENKQLPCPAASHRSSVLCFFLCVSELVLSRRA